MLWLDGHGYVVLREIDRKSNFREHGRGSKMEREREREEEKGLLRSTRSHFSLYYLYEVRNWCLSMQGTRSSLAHSLYPSRSMSWICRRMCASTSNICCAVAGHDAFFRHVGLSSGATKRPCSKNIYNPQIIYSIADAERHFTNIPTFLSPSRGRARIESNKHILEKLTPIGKRIYTTYGTSHRFI